MSSHPGFTVESYVYDAWHNMTEKQYQFVIEVYKSNPGIVKYIEDKLIDYDEDEDGSWRTYRNSMANTIDESWNNEEKKIQVFIKTSN